ncbi:MAG: hypothetical protein IKB77_04580 [Lentisphaeria bacterium]|nr:hypothetical protein [Lentisphaeria bacterium]
MKNIIAAAIIAVTIAAVGVLFVNSNKQICLETRAAKPQKIYGFGYVRGRSQTTLKNKYAGFVKKVYHYSYAKVKKGDVILEYDDLDIRTAIQKLEHSIAEQVRNVELKKINLEMVELDPLPSQYRNLQLRRQSAQATLDRSSHEYEVYRKLSRDKVVADLTYRAKMEEFKNSQADLRQLDQDLKILGKGLSDLYIKKAELELSEAETRLKDLKEQLALLKEELKYYKIVAPYDGMTITNSDTVHGYNAVGTSAAAVHRIDRKYVYCYFTVEDVRYLHVGDKLNFISQDKPRDKQGTVVQIFDIATGRTTYGDKAYFTVKCKIIEDPQDLLIDTIGTLEFEIQ